MIQSPKTLEFLKKIRDSGNWNDDYDYSKVKFINKYEKVIVINKPSLTNHEILAHLLLIGCNIIFIY